ncbi:hypothetical protein IEO21_08842 [Rhodonia placenta]|uniref:Uncharacterized protein n=1 Tax=Rhodonia placenta TaxID=104341 RepID=A0A8H7NVW1_9APHY|nr:hypothetical protein IEO21_08842 [Postia placenta]
MTTNLQPRQTSIRPRTVHEQIREGGFGLCEPQKVLEGLPGAASQRRYEQHNGVLRGFDEPMGRRDGGWAQASKAVTPPDRARCKRRVNEAPRRGNARTGCYSESRHFARVFLGPAGSKVRAAQDNQHGSGANQDNAKPVTFGRVTWIAAEAGRATLTLPPTLGSVTRRFKILENADISARVQGTPRSNNTMRASSPSGFVANKPGRQKRRRPKTQDCPTRGRSPKAFPKTAETNGELKKPSEP